MRGDTSEKSPFGALAVVDVHQPLGEKCGDVGVVRGGGREDLGVAHPAHAFVALRAVGRNAKKIAALAPDDILKKPIEIGVGTFPRAGLRRVGTDDDAAQIIGRESSGITGDFDVAESVEGELRLEGFRSADDRL